MPLVLYARRVRRPRLQSKPHTLPGCRAGHTCGALLGDAK